MREISEVQQICRAPSISLGVIHEGQIIFRRSIGLRDIEENLEANSDTSYLIASCSKLFTSAAVGILVGNKLSLADTIHQHLPDFDPVEDPQIGKKATILDLCRHSTGLGNPNMAFNGPGGTITAKDEDHISIINSLPTSNKSGQRFNNWWFYSNIVFGSLAKIVEAASGLKFPAFMREQICKPLGLKQTLLTESEVDSNDNLAYPYVQRVDGSWAKINNGITTEKYSPSLASMGIRSSVNDILTFCAAVMNCYDREREVEPPHPLPNGVVKNPLSNIFSLWDSWWSRPCDDGFANNTAYTLGWFRTRIPTCALGMLSYNSVRRKEDIIGKKSQPRILYGHNGVTNGSVATAYVIPESHSAVVALSNAADAGDAAGTTAEILIQALFDLKPHVDLVQSVRMSRDERMRMHEAMISDWEKHRDVSNYKADPRELVGSYLGLGSCRIDIIESGNSSSGLAVVFGSQDASRCELEPFNTDSLSFLPLEHDVKLERGMIDWDFWTVGVFNFLREDADQKDSPVIGLRWKWDQYDYAGLWVKTHHGMSNTEIDAIIEKHGRFLKEDKED